jgi:aspartate-semialdehyde dehydrogenase
MARVGVVGATGQVGSLMRSILAERGFPVEEIRYFASAGSAGRELDWQGAKVVVEDSFSADFTGLDLVLMSSGKAVSKELAPKIAQQGAIVVDNSSAWRMDPEVPLVVSEVNPHALDGFTSAPGGKVQGTHNRFAPGAIVANPNCTTMVAMPALSVIHRAAVIIRMNVVSFQAASGAGRAGVADLGKQSRVLAPKGEELALREPKEALQGAEFSGSVFPGPLAFNVLPLAGSYVDDGSGWTDEERKLVDESRKILDAPGLQVMATCTRVPVFTGHSLAITLQTEMHLKLPEVLELLASAPGMRMETLPTPLDATGQDNVLVGRVREDPTLPNGLSLWVSGDNLRKGAALNAVQIAEVLLEKGML